jgi:hypothetical protein
MVLVASMAPVLASAGEKQQGNMVTTFPVAYSRDSCNVGHVPAPPSPAFVAGVSQGKFKFDDKCKGQIQLAKLSGLPVDDGIPGSGDEVLCLLNFHSGSGGCGSFVLRGGVSASGKVKIKFDGGVDLPAGFCPPPPTDAHVTSVECYDPDPAYPVGAACAGAGGVYTPFVTDPSQGVCSGGTAFITNPGTPVLAVQGLGF